MTVTEQERQKILAEYEAKKHEELCERMRALGKTKSAKKRKSSQRNIKLANAARLGSTAKP